MVLVRIQPRRLINSNLERSSVLVDIRANKDLEENMNRVWCICGCNSLEFWYDDEFDHWSVYWNHHINYSFYARLKKAWRFVFDHCGLHDIEISREQMQDLAVVMTKEANREWKDPAITKMEAEEGKVKKTLEELITEFRALDDENMEIISKALEKAPEHRIHELLREMTLNKIGGYNYWSWVKRIKHKLRLYVIKKFV
jgi:hypothetical protein